MLYRVILLLALVAPPSASAQDVVAGDVAEDEEDGTICLAIGHGWIGDNADIRDIDRIPVPTSYREPFEARDSCASFQLIKESLIDWHLRFGSEHSLSAALAYLERAYLNDQLPPTRYIEALRRAAREVRGENRPLLLLKSFMDARQSYVFLAEQYLRAAEELRSPTLLEQAERYLRPAVLGGTLLAALETDPGEKLDESDLETFRTDDLEMRAAVLRTRLDPSDERIARAEAVLQSKERPYYHDLAALAFTAGEDLCDLSRGGPGRQLEVAEAACQADEDYLHERVVNFLQARAALDLIAGRDRANTFDSAHYRAMRLLESELFFEASRQRQSTMEDMLRLHMTAAESLRRQARRPRRRGAGYGPLFEALGELEKAERLARPYDAPARFRRVAEASLEAFEELGAEMQRDERGDLESAYPAYVRHAAYLRRTLANLDAIARGSE